MLCNKPATQDKQLKQANCPAVVLFPTTAPTIYIQKHKTSAKNKIAETTAQRTDKNYTVKDYCANKTLKIDENGINTDIAFLHKTLLKNTQHTLQLHIENFYERNKIAGATAQPTEKLHGERLLLKQNIEN